MDELEAMLLEFGLMKSEEQATAEAEALERAAAGSSATA